MQVLFAQNRVFSLFSRFFKQIIGGFAHFINIWKDIMDEKPKQTQCHLQYMQGKLALEVSYSNW